MINKLRPAKGETFFQKNGSIEVLWEPTEDCPKCKLCGGDFIGGMCVYCFNTEEETE